jgi:AcrR family transcriptional regulator
LLLFLLKSALQNGKHSRFRTIRILKANSVFGAYCFSASIAEGWQAVTIRRISEAIEYTTSFVYSHFENKDALLNEIMTNGFNQMYALSEKALKTTKTLKKNYEQFPL